MMTTISKTMTPESTIQITAATTITMIAAITPMTSTITATTTTTSESATPVTPIITGEKRQLQQSALATAMTSTTVVNNRHLQRTGPFTG